MINKSLKFKMEKTSTTNYGLSNARYLAVFAVIVGHMGIVGESILPLWYSIPEAFKNMCYLFAIPVLSFISGFFSTKNFDLKKNIVKLIIPFVIFELLFCESNYYEPTTYLWYLPSLFYWRYLVDIIEKVNGNEIVKMLIIIAIAITIPFFIPNGNLFGVKYTVIFAPYFFAGYFVRKNNIEIKFNRYVAFSILISIALIVAAGVIGKDFIYPYIYGNNPSIMYQIKSIAIRAILIISVLSVMPYIKLLSGNTLYPYLWHVPVSGLFIGSTVAFEHNMIVSLTCVFVIYLTMLSQTFERITFMVTEPWKLFYAK